MSTWVWLDERDAHAIHERLLVLQGGAEGVRDAGLLSSALARARQSEARGRDPDACDLAAVYTAGIVKNHPFVDGNKRAAFVLGLLLLELNGLVFTASEEAATRAVLDLAAGDLEVAGYAAFLRGNAASG